MADDPTPAAPDLNAVLNVVKAVAAAVIAIGGHFPALWPHSAAVQQALVTLKSPPPPDDVNAMNAAEISAAEKSDA